MYYIKSSAKIIKSREIRLSLPSLYTLSSAITVGSISKKLFVTVRKSAAILSILAIFYKYGRIRGYSFLPNNNVLIQLGYYRNEPFIRKLDVFKAQASSRHFSKSFLYNYVAKAKVIHPSTLLILSTPVGIVTH